VFPEIISTKTLFGENKDKLRIISACIALSSEKKEDIKESGIFKSCY
jgi:hypothetical protein